MVGVASCCARAASGHAAAAPPISVMNSRRLMPDKGFLPPAWREPNELVYRMISLPPSGRASPWDRPELCCIAVLAGPSMCLPLEQEAHSERLYGQVEERAVVPFDPAIGYGIAVP